MRYGLMARTMGLLAVAACGGLTSYSGGGGGSQGGHSTTITVNNDFFSPAPDTIPAGDITFTWATPSDGHTLTWDSGPGTLPANITNTTTSGSFTFNGLQPGVYKYHCSIHGAPGAGMHGKIVVQ